MEVIVTRDDMRAIADECDRILDEMNKEES